MSISDSSSNRTYGPNCGLRSVLRGALAGLGIAALLGLGCKSAERAEPESPEPAGEAAQVDEPAEDAGEDAGEDAVKGADEASANASLVAAADRSEEDRGLDPQRHPVELLDLLDLQPGMKVADMMAGYGYTTELLARAVGPTGVVYGQNNAFVIDRFAEKPWSERLAREVMGNVVRVDRELDDPLPPEASELDAVVMVLFYHDSVWMKADRAAMNRGIFAALRPGGSYLIVDHSGRAGTGDTETKTLHRIDEAFLRAEVEAAGFELAAEADFLRNAEDTRDWNAAPSAAIKSGKRGESDRFVLKFVKPG